ncbi:hypothetical protein SiRe_0550 [Sulfolobus islandicus REY15A]|uniref:Uncharacterized protein n=1 Tax=Saccharolobus islandicus (strain REY15A) TaxID=930945 RepID=F0NDS6_SACI5|nr:hypothetical protein SiRe_0550 [Sulfolobus islandicus REY15A]
MGKSKNNLGRGNTIRESNTMKVMEEIREKVRKAILSLSQLVQPFPPEPRGFLTLLTSIVPFSTSLGRLDTTSIPTIRRRASTRS